MIFIATGTQYPFDRLLKAVEACNWPEDEKIIAQAGSNSHFTSMRIKCITSMTGEAFDNYIQQSRLVIAHAGMGTILSAISHGKPIICSPRLHQFKEHINDHQSDTLSMVNHPLLIKCFDLNLLSDAVNQAVTTLPSSYALPSSTLSQAVLAMLHSTK